jgi:hypothetical protein
MNEQKKRLFLIKMAYWLGIAADATWAIALMFPGFFSILTGRPDFNPDLEFRLVMGIAASLMTGWTFLLLWAVRKPIERRVVILLTAFPVVTGMFIVALVGDNIWIVVKTTILIISMITSYLLANRMSKEK